jgi:hypothetical protein
MILFEGGGAFLPKRTIGAISENWKTDPSLSDLGLRDCVHNVV